MPTLLYHTKIPPVNAIATTQQAGFEAPNLLLPSLLRNWRATGAGAIDLTLDLGASQALGGVLIHDVNFASATVYTSVDGTTFTNRGTMTCNANTFGRRRGIFSLNTYTGRYVRLTIAAATPSDGLSYWRAGAAYVMKTVVTLAQSPNKGYSVKANFPAERTGLANGRTAIAGTGAAFDEIAWSFTRKYQDSLETLMTQLRAGTVLVDMGLPQFPHHVWPVATQDESHGCAYPKANSETSAVTLVEQV